MLQPRLPEKALYEDNNVRNGMDGGGEGEGRDQAKTREVSCAGKKGKSADCGSTRARKTTHRFCRCSSVLASSETTAVLEVLLGHF